MMEVHDMNRPRYVSMVHLLNKLETKKAITLKIC